MNGIMGYRAQGPGRVGKGYEPRLRVINSANRVNRVGPMGIGCFPRERPFSVKMMWFTARRGRIALSRHQHEGWS